MRHLLLCAAALLLAGACAEGETPLSLYDPAERDAAQCEAAGLAPQSEAHQACMARAAYYRQARREYRSLAGPNVRCTAGSNAGGCF